MAHNGIDELSEKQFDSFIQKPVAVVDFFADWCMPCLMMAPVIEEMSEKFKGRIAFAKLNVDDNQKLSQKFKVMSIPTLIVFKKGEEAGRLIDDLIK
ncbi:thioredoxin [Candidatus Pacearchaeota archaeon]|nr:thioredoxin [Candidatus Pacearchaeota archaeon]